jgi:hypothetical protein
MEKYKMFQTTNQNIYISNDMFQAPYGLHAPLLGHHGLPMFETTNQLVKSHSRVTHQWLPDPDL